MKQHRKDNFVQTATFSYGMVGAAFGLCFPIGATIFDLLVQGLPFTLAGAIELQRENPLHWIIDTAPLFLGLFAAYGGMRQEEIARLSQELEARVHARTSELENSNTELQGAII